MEDERRLLYVAMTRAKKSLTLMYLLMDSTNQVQKMSPFIYEMQLASAAQAQKTGMSFVEVVDGNEVPSKTLLFVEQLEISRLLRTPRGYQRQMPRFPRQLPRRTNQGKERRIKTHRNRQGKRVPLSCNKFIILFLEQIAPSSF